MADKSEKENPQFKVHKTFTKKKWLIIAGILIALIGSAVIASVLIMINSNDISKDNSKEQIIAEENKRDNEANAHIYDNDPDAAIGVYQKSIDSYIDNDQKASAYIEMAAMLYDYDPVRYKERVLQYAYEAEKIAPSAVTATFVSDMETNYGNEQAADKYLAIAKDRTKGDQNVGS